MKVYLSFFCILALALTSCNRPDYKSYFGAVWGTTYHITYSHNSNLSDSITAQMRQVELSLSIFDNQSTIYAINSGKSDSVDYHFEQVFNVAKRVYTLSHGAFNPCVEPLVEIWGFNGDEPIMSPIPDATTIKQTLQRICFDQCSIVDHRFIRPRSDIKLDFSAIAKGYGVDCVAQMLRRNGVDNYMVEIGGEIAVAGVNPDGKPWHILIDAPVRDTAPGDSALQVIEITDQAIATSGNYRNYRFDSNGNVYGHIIDPRTGYPTQSPTVSATVVASTCVEADALATACMVLSPSEALDMIERANARVVLVVADNSSSDFRIISTLNQ